MPETAADVVLKGISLPLPLLLKSGVMSSGFISHAGRTAGRDSAGCLLPEGGTIGLDSSASTIVPGPAQAGVVGLPLALRLGTEGGALLALCGLRFS